MGLQQVAKTLITQVVRKTRCVTSSCRVGTAEQLGLELEQLAGDTVQIHKSPLSEITSYLQSVAREGKSFKPTFENPNSPFAQYIQEVELYNAQELKKGAIKIGLFNVKPKTKEISLNYFKEYVFKNADKLNISKEEYWQLVDEVAASVKKETMQNPNGLRKEFIENADRIQKWAEIFRTQHFENGKNIYNKFYDEKMFNQAIKDYTEFVEQITGKKVLIGCPSRMNFPISAMGMLNNPKAYKDVDCILLGHGKGSSLITDVMHPDTWRFSDNDKSIYEFIEKNIPKDKKVLVFCCETDGLSKVGKTLSDMVDRKGQQMYGVGDMVMSGFSETSQPAKICQSGVRHIIGQMSENGSSASKTIIGSVDCQGKHAGLDFSLSLVKNPKTILYDLDYSKYRVENLL